jgi:hypothetical protein
MMHSDHREGCMSISPDGGPCTCIDDYSYRRGTRDEVARHEEWRTSVLSVLEKLEWSSSSQDSEMSDRIYGLCPECGHGRSSGHREGCMMNKALHEYGGSDA